MRSGRKHRNCSPKEKRQETGHQIKSRARPTSGTNNADLAPVAFWSAVRTSSSVKSSHGSTSWNRQILSLDQKKAASRAVLSTIYYYHVGTMRFGRNHSSSIILLQITDKKLVKKKIFLLAVLKDDSFYS